MTVGGVAALAKHKLVRMRVAAAAHPDATTTVLAALAADPSRQVRRVVAARPDTPEQSLRALAADADRATREAVAANAATPPDVLVSLLSDGDFGVRWAVTTNPCADPRVRQAVCVSPDRDLRLVLAQLPGLSAEIVTLLAADPDRRIRETVAERTDDPAILRALLTDPDPDVRGHAAHNAGTTAAQRQDLMHDPIATVRAAVVYAGATHGWDIPEDDLLRLARDRSALVRYQVAMLAGFLPPLYDILTQDPDESVATAARESLLASHPLFRDEVRNKFMRRVRDST